MAVTEKQSFVSTARFSELLKLFLPLLIMSFSNYIFLFLEQLLLARYSTLAMEAALCTAYVCQIFQLPCIVLAMMAQVSVGQWLGEKNFKMIGPGIWQFIWFSFLSLLITIPISIFYEKFHFENNELKEIATPYFYFLMWINFLYPLSTVLSCFYLGQGKAKLIFVGSLLSQFLKLILAYVLIFGLPGFIPSFGLMGGAISTFLAKGSFCFLLFYFFLRKKEAEVFNSWDWTLKPFLFFESIRPGISRALNRILTMTCWKKIAFLMTAQGDFHLLSLSIGGTLFLCFPFIGEAVCQAQTTIVSNLLGAKNYHLLSKSFSGCSLLVIFFIILLSIPLVIFPLETFYLLFSNIEIEDEAIRKIFFGIWVSFSFFTYGFVPISYILAFKDTTFSLFMGVFNWINGYGLMYAAIIIFNMPAEQFWLVLALMHSSNAIFYLIRMQWLKSKLEANPSEKQVLTIKTG